ncbi:hypothetical protein GCM10009821_27590 [Aeromicrobium halocynthiae]|uniref:Uncharacterized protein n=1 Tax=Aeromicrobium halocynthiae TaxID=560557 RepID=A0ABP5HVD6_9ACTN
MGRPKEFDTTVHVRLDFMQHAFIKQLAQLGGITMAAPCGPWWRTPCRTSWTGAPPTMRRRRHE